MASAAEVISLCTRRSRRLPRGLQCAIAFAMRALLAVALAVLGCTATIESRSRDAATDVRVETDAALDGPDVVLGVDIPAILDVPDEDAVSVDAGPASDTSPGADAADVVEAGLDVADAGACAEVDAIEVPGRTAFVAGAWQVLFDATNAPRRVLPFPATSCVLNRDRAAVFHYTPPADAPINVVAAGVIEVFEGCGAGATAIACAPFNLWTPTLRAGRSVFIVVTQIDTAEGRAAFGASGAISIRPTTSVPEGGLCDDIEFDRAFEGARVCGPALRCFAGRCVPNDPRLGSCNPQRSDCPAPLRCAAAGVCARAGGEQEICSVLAPCAEGLRCYWSPAGEMRCQRPRAEGAHCVVNSVDPVCADGLWCDLRTQTCARPMPLGAACANRACSPEECPSGNCGGCIRRPCGPDAACVDGRCEARESRPWGPCDLGDPLGCPSGHGCVANRCAPDAVGEGMPCHLVRGPGCDVGLRCVRGVCTRPMTRGARCEGHAECPASMRCGRSGLCGIEGDDGQRCRITLPRCNDGGRCIEGHCLVRQSCAYALPGTECGEGRSCGGTLSGRPCLDDGTLDARCRSGAAERARGLCDAGLRCADGRCIAVRALGETCGVTDLGNCVEGASCNRRCVPNGSEGADCRIADGRRTCDSGLDCVDGRCRRRHLASGATCEPLADVCLAPLRCNDLTRRCGTVGGPSQRCIAPEGSCEPGLRCEGFWFARCGRVVSLGQQCTTLRTCGDGLVCTNGACTTAGALGSTCADHPSSCAPGLRCVGTVCREVVGEGGACDVNHVCESRLSCRAGRCAAITPAPPGAAREPCGDGEAPCAAGLSCFGDRCFRGLDPGAACEESGLPTAVCGSGLFCRNGVCPLLGVLGTPCRDAPPLCASDAICHYGTCVARAAPGARCEVEHAVCAEGHHCVAADGALRCARDGGAGAWCRWTDPPCDEGTRCNPATRRCEATR